MHLTKFLTALLLSTVSISASASEDIEIVRQVNVDSFLKANNVSVLATQPITQLNDLDLVMKITNQGVVYVDEKKGVVFTNAKAFQVTNNNGLIQLDRAGIDRYLDTVPDKIFVKAPNEKGVLTVFTDITCGWCQKVHEDIPAYLDMGISLEFILFPREGIASKTALTMSAIQATDNQASALNLLMKGQYPMTSPTSISDQVAEHYVAAQAMQVNATPTMFYKGLRIEGYIAPQSLERMQ